MRMNLMDIVNVESGGNTISVVTHHYMIMKNTIVIYCYELNKVYHDEKKVTIGTELRLNNGAVVDVTRILDDYGEISFTCNVVQHGVYHFSLEDNDYVEEHFDRDNSFGKVLE